MARNAMLALLVACLLIGCLRSPRIDRGPDTLSEALLSPEIGRTLIDVHYMAGSEPSMAALDAFVVWASNVTKRNVTLGLVAEFEGRPHSEDDRWGVVEIFAAHRASFTRVGPGLFAHDGAAVIHVMYLDGRPDDESFDGGLSLDEVIAMWPRNWHAWVAPSDIPVVEETILRHEFAHSLGLVNRGIPMVTSRESLDHPGHSAISGGIMYADQDRATESDLARWRRGDLLDLDPYDLADIEAFRAALK